MTDSTPAPIEHWCRCYGSFEREHCDDCCRGGDHADGTC